VTDILRRLQAGLADRYTIERKIGAGGMATVYLAEDIRHDRNVALKVLRPELAAVLGAERFIQEIKTTASLQHPHILPLFDSGEADGFLYYVMPFIEGETLRDKLDRDKQLGIDEAVRITTEVADALEYAHRQSVIHRDIKPENILLHDGRPMVADFGIALAVSAAAGGRMTETGLSLGTPHYMSPEQATAQKNLTNRSDIYSLGAMLYEMLTGDPPHTGSTAQQIISKIVTEEPAPITKARKSVPPNVAAAVAKALEKLPADRFASVASFAAALSDTTFRWTTSESGAAATPGRRSRSAIAAVALALLAVVAAWGWLRPAPTRSAQVTRYVHGFAVEERLVPTPGVSVAVSPDGAHIVYVGPSDHGRQLWIRERGQLRARPIPGTENAWQPFFAPDGGSVAFVTGDRQLKVVPLAGEPLTLVDGGLELYGGAWGQDGFVYFSTAAGLMRVPASGGDAPEPVARTDTDSPEVKGYGWPDVLANGRGVLFTIIRNHVPNLIAAVDLQTGDERVLMEGMVARYAESGQVVYVQEDGALMAAPFDQDGLDVTGARVLLRDRLPEGSFPDLAISKTGRLVYVTRPRPTLEAVWVDRDGNWSPVDPDDPIQGIRYAALSPDDTKLVVNTWLQPPNDDGHLWVKQLPRGAYSRLTFDGTVNHRPSWMPDSRSVLFISDRGGSRDVWVQRADGTTAAELLYSDSMDIDEAFLTPDGEWLVYRRGMQDGERDILAIRLSRDSVATALVTSNFDEVAPAISADGRWLAYVSGRDGEANVYVRPFPGADAETQVSRNGGSEPVWSRNTSELFFRNGDDEMVVATVLPGDQFRIGSVDVLFSTAAYRSDFFHAAYHISADGQRFVMLRESDSGSLDEQLVVVENWFEELRAKVGGDDE